MATILQIDRHRPADQRRWTVGVLVASDCSRLAATLVAAGGQALGLRAEIVDGMIAEVPKDVASLFAQLTGPGAAVPPAAALEGAAALRALLAELQASVVNALLAQAGVAPARILAIGVHDPGLWSTGHGARMGYLGLCDAARLAELTGLNVIDAFPARDVARGGLGGPLTPLAEWVLLRAPGLNRVLLDLGRTTRLSFLPRDLEHGEPRVLGFDVGPGMRLLDLLVQRLTGNEQAFDPGGRFAVQGRRLDELIEHWMADPYLRRPLPRWQPRGVRPERYLVDALQMAVQTGWSVRDLLCTATHFIAETVALAIHKRMPEDVTVDQVVFTGGGQHNGMLLREIATLFPEAPLVRVDELGIEGEALGPASIALLALFHLDQVPSNRPELTGTDVPRVLGRLTPGSPQSWQRLLTEMANSRPVVRPLRAAL